MTYKKELQSYHRTLLTPGLDNTRLFMSLTAGAGTRCMSLLSSSPSLVSLPLPLRLSPVVKGERRVTAEKAPDINCKVTTIRTTPSFGTGSHSGKDGNTS